MRRLAEAGLTTREACGSAVRNVTACPYAGVAGGRGVRRHALRGGAHALLPAPSARGRAAAQVQDRLRGLPERPRAHRDQRPRLARRASTATGRRGFRVTVGGGTSILPRSGELLYDFLPAGEILEVAEAVLRVFHDRGDYKHKQRNRHEVPDPRHGLRRLAGGVRRGARGRSAQRAAIALPFDPDASARRGRAARAAGPRPRHGEVAARASAAELSGPGLRPPSARAARRRAAPTRAGLRTNVRPAEAGRATRWSTVTRAAGRRDRRAAARARRPGRGLRRRHGPHHATTRTWRCAGCATPTLPDALRAARRGGPGRCRTRARSRTSRAARAPRPAASRSRSRAAWAACWATGCARVPTWWTAAPGLDIKISGCPNGCGQHHVAGLGFQGSVRQAGRRGRSRSTS